MLAWLGCFRNLPHKLRSKESKAIDIYILGPYWRRLLII